MAESQEHQLQLEWRHLIVSKLDSLEQKVDHLNTIILAADLSKLQNHETRIDRLEKNQAKATTIFAVINTIAIIAWTLFAHFSK